MKKTVKSEALMPILRAIIGSATISHDAGEFAAEHVCKKVMTELAYAMGLSNDEMRQVIADGFKIADQAKSMMDMPEGATLQ